MIASDKGPEIYHCITKLSGMLFLYCLEWVEITIEFKINKREHFILWNDIFF